MPPGVQQRAGDERDAMKGRQWAESAVRRLAEQYAAVAMRTYKALGYSFDVQARKVGTSYRLEVVGDQKAQMWARIVEGGSASVPMRQFIEGAKKRREIKLTRVTPSGKTVSRGAKETAAGGGFYLIVPIVHGTVTRGANGKLQLTTNGGQSLSKRLGNQLEQFLGAPQEEGYAANHDDPNVVSPYRTGQVDPLGQVTRVNGKNVYSPTPVMATGNELWATTRYRQVNRVRKGGVFVNEENEVVPNRQKGQGTVYQDRGFLEAKDARRRNPSASEKGSDLIRQLTGRSDLSLRVNDPDASLPDDVSVSPETRATFERQKGQAVSFITLSTRQALKDIPGRAGHHVLADTMREMQSALRTEVTRLRQQHARNLDKPTVRAMLEVLEQAAR